MYKQGALNDEVYNKEIEPLVKRFLDGYNACLLCFGEYDSGKAFSLIGEPGHRTGLIPLSVATMFKFLFEGIFFLR